MKIDMAHTLANRRCEYAMADETHKVFMTPLKWTKLNPEAVAPDQAYPDDAGYDLRAAWAKWADNDMYIEYGTGLAFEIPPGFCGLAFPRSSLSDYDLALSNSVGVIDSGYRGEVRFRFRVLKNYRPKIYGAGDRIGQLVVVALPKIRLVYADMLSASARGDNGHGSSGR